MNWEAIGAIGEIGGFMVVLVTLLFLYAQVRQIVTQNKPAGMDASTRSGQLMQMQVATHPELASLLIQARAGPQNLAPEQLVQLRAYVGYQALNWQSMFLQMELGPGVSPKGPQIYPTHLKSLLLNEGDM